MSDPLIMLAIVAAAVTGVSLVLARLIPDEYDSLKPAVSPARRTTQR